MNRKITWNLLSKYRSELFGFAIISIIIFHYFEDLNATNISGILKVFTKGYIWLIGSIGVEIFIFLSGLGLYYSLRKQFNISRYIYNRVERTIIPYLIYGGFFWIVVDIILSKRYIKNFLYDYSLLSFWIDGNKHLWFVAFIIVIYIIFPYIYILFVRQNSKTQKRNFIFLICTMYLLVLITILKIFPSFFQNTEIALTRVPVFVLGLYYGEKCYEKVEFSKVDILFLLFSLLLRGVSIFDGSGNIPIYWRIRIGIYSILIMCVFVVFLDTISCDLLNQTLRAVGKYSYELYLTTVTTRIVMKELGYETFHLPIYVISILAAVLLSYLLIKIEKCFNKNFYEKVLSN